MNSQDSIDLSVLKPLIDFGFREAIIEYNGSGDDGNVDDIDIKFSKRSVSPEREHEFRNTISDLAYQIIDKYFVGWENSDSYYDGADGTLIISFDGRYISYNLNHKYYIREEHSENKNNKVDFIKIS